MIRWCGGGGYARGFNPNRGNYMMGGRYGRK